jgi:hypothetical protein
MVVSNGACTYYVLAAGYEMKRLGVRMLAHPRAHTCGSRQQYRWAGSAASRTGVQWSLPLALIDYRELGALEVGASHRREDTPGMPSHTRLRGQLAAAAQVRPVQRCCSTQRSMYATRSG